MRRLVMRLTDELDGQFYGLEMYVDPVALSRGDVDTVLVDAFESLNKALDAKMQAPDLQKPIVYIANRESQR